LEKSALDYIDATHYDIASKEAVKKLLTYVEMEGLKDFLLKWKILKQAVGANNDNLKEGQRQAALLDIYNDVLCCCIMRQTDQKELESFNQAVTLLTQQQDLTPSLATIKSLYDARINNFAILQTNGADDACRPVIMKFCWTLHVGISLLSPRVNPHLQFAADPILLNWILKANHFPVTVEDVPGDGNCFLYAIHLSLQSVDVDGDTSRVPQALRWLLSEKAVLFLDQDVSELEALKNDCVFCVGDICMPLLCFFFGMNMRVLSATAPAPGSGTWMLQCNHFTFRSQKWNDWVCTTTLANKFPFLEWDPVIDAEAIRNFKAMGGAHAFVKVSTVTFDGSAFTATTFTGKEVVYAANPCDDLNNAVPTLLGHLDPDADTKDQLTIAFTSCGSSGHYCALLPIETSGSPIFVEAKRNELSVTITSMLQQSSTALEERCLCSNRSCNGCPTFQALTTDQRLLFRERMAKQLNQELVAQLNTYANKTESNSLFTVKEWYHVTPLRLSRLASNQWIDNETINISMDLLADKHRIREREKSSLIIHSVASNVHLNYWSKWNTTFDETLQGQQVKGKWKLKTLELDKIYVPFHQNQNHWILGIVEMGKSTVRIFDSCYPDNYDAFNAALLHWIELEFKMQDQHFESLSWKVGHEEGPRQTNNHDCALFVLAAAEMEMMGIGHIYDQTMMPYLRQRVGCEILECRLQDEQEVTVFGETSETGKPCFQYFVS
jgi:hypothetical protein